MFYILVSSRCPCFHIMAEHITYILNKNNIPVKMCFDKIEDKITKEDNLFVFWNNILLDKSQVFDNIFIYNLDTTIIENVGIEITKFINVSKELCTRLQVLNFSSNKSDVTFFEKMNITCKILHYGYSDFHEKIYTDVYEEPNDAINNIDILFYGAITEIRINKLREIENFCREKGYTHFFTNNLYDERKKAKLVKKSKIVISIPSSKFVSEAGTNDLCRLSFLISNKVFCIAEKLNGDVEDDLERYGLKMISYENFLENLDYYLKNPKEREIISGGVYENFKKEYNFEQTLLKIIFNEINV